MLSHPLHQGHADNAVGGWAGEGTEASRCGSERCKGEMGEPPAEPLMGVQLPSVTAPTVKGRGVLRAGLVAVIPAVTMCKGTKLPPEQFCWGHLDAPWSHQRKERSGGHLHQQMRSVAYLG